MKHLWKLVLCGALLLLAASSLPVPARSDDPDVRRAVIEAFAELGVKPEQVRVHDLDFWKRHAAGLIRAGHMRKSARLPGERDALRPALVDRAVREPLEAVSLGLRCARRDPPPALLPMLGEPKPAGLAPGEDPIPADAPVPRGVRRLAALMVALDDAVAAVVPEGEPDARVRSWLLQRIPPLEDVAAVRKAFDRHANADWDRLRDAALSVVAEVHALRKMSIGFPSLRPRRIETKRGLVILGTRGKDRFDEDAWIIVDPGGNDLWTCNAGGTAGGFRTALAVDLGGNDTYRSETPFVQGASFEGVGLLVDLRGDDQYEGDTFSQGVAVGGVGILHDARGEDRYDAHQFSQGAAAFGYGLLHDAGKGDDRYAVDCLGQGLGRTGGIGCLRDEKGNERYEARPVHVSHYSDWTGGTTVHWSFAQGCGVGSFTRFEEKVSGEKKVLVIHDMVPGGVGVLQDESGDDVYAGSMYAQGTSWFQALGLCVDLDGDDVYTATWYGQGAAPHYTAGILVDARGDDRYTGMRQVQGCGRDYATGVLLDLAGDDEYVGDERVQGCGDHRDGYGIFVDAGGADRYTARTRIGRGWTTNVDPKQQPTPAIPDADWGIFIDLGGKDTYLGKAAGANGTTWIQKETGRGIGVDR